MSPSICFVNDFFLKDEDVVTTGPMVQMYLIGRELVCRGWQVDHVVTTKNKRAEGTEKHDGMIVHYLPHHRYGELSGLRPLLKKLNEVDADVYYQRGRASMTGIVAYHARRHGKKFVWSAAGEAGMARGKYMLEQLGKKSGIRKSLLFPCFWLQDRVYEYGIQHAHVVLAQTQYQLMRLREEFSREGVLVRSGHPIPNPGVLEKPDPPIVMWIGAVKSVKQPGLFLELADRLRDEEASFTMIGRLVDESFRAMIEQQAKARKNFNYLGETPFNRTTEWFSKASLVVNTTLPGYEGLPNVFAQSWLHGVPVVSLNSDPDGVMKKHGIGYRTGSFDAMVQKTRELIRNTSLRSQMSRTCHSFALQEYSVDKIVDRFIEIIHANRQLALT